MSCFCCPCWNTPKPPAPTYEVSIAVQPRPATISRSVQPSYSIPPSPSTVDSRSISVAHARFSSTDQITLITALRAGPNPTQAPIPEGIDKKYDDRKYD